MRSRLAGVAAVVGLGLLALAPTAQAVTYEQTGVFAGSATPLTKEQIEHDEEIQLAGVSGMAVNHTGAGGVPKGTVYAATKSSDTWIAMYWPKAAGGLEFKEAWKANREPGSYPRCGPLLGTGCAAPAEASSHSIDVEVDQENGNVFALRGFEGGQTGLDEVVEFSADGSAEISRFGEIAPSGESIAESPAKVHERYEPGGLAIGAGGRIYVFDEKRNVYHRLMVFEPESPGDYSHYVYKGEVLAGTSGEHLPSLPVTDNAGNLFVGVYQENHLEEYAAEEPKPYPAPTPSPTCTYTKAGINAIAVNPVTDEPFVYSNKAQTEAHWVRYLGPCSEGKFKEVGKVRLSPERGDIYAMVFDPEGRAEPSRPKGTLYAGVPNLEFVEGTGEPGQSSLGYIYGQPKGPAKALSVSKSGGGAGTVTSEPIGIECGTLCTQQFEEGESVTLVAIPAEGSTFSGWSGECESTTGNKCKVKMSAARSVTASFAKEGGGPPEHALSASVSGEGEVKCKFGGGSAGPCTSPQPDGTAVEVIATAKFGSQFKEWSATAGSATSCQGSTAVTCSFTLSADTSLTAVFVPTAKPKFKLTVSKSGTGSGTVTSTPAGINCGSGAGCEAEFEEGVEVTLNQTAASGSEFKEWTGACTGSGSCKVTMSAAKSVGAVFSPIPRTLSIAKAGTGTGEVKCKFAGGSAGACTSPQPNGTAVELIATANPGSTFAGFSSGTGSAASCTTSPCSFTLEANSTLTATFNLTAKPKFKLTVSKSGTGSGTVTSTPSGINCGSGAGCEAEFEEGTEVTLNQAASSGSEFKEWTGACSGSGTCKVTMSTAKAVGAVFSLIPRTLTITKAGTGTGEVKCKFNGGSAGACTSPQPNGTAVELIATANPGSTFAGFSAGTGSLASCSTSPCSFTIEANSSVTATFNLTAKPKFKLTVSKSGTGSGTVTSTPAGINCGSGAGCEAEFEEGVEVTLNQAATSGSEFKEWTGACSGSGACKVTMSAAKSVGAVFSPIPRTLSITKAGTGTGEVKCKFAGGSAGACTSPQPNGTAVELIATANPGSTFAGFSAGTGSAGSCSASPCSFTLEANSSLTATFNLTAKPKFKLTVSKSGTGSGTVTSTPSGINCGSGAGCEAEFEEGAEVELKETPASGSEFKEWSGACSGSGTCKVTMSAAKSVGAVFNLKPKPKFKLSIAKAGTGSGTVTSTPAGIDCGSVCEAEFEEGTEVTLAQAASPGSEFKEWSGACSGSGTCKVTMSSAKNVGARFNPAAKPKFKLSVSKTGGGTGTIVSSPAGINCGSVCEHEYEEGTHVTLTESPGAGSEFGGWQTLQCDESTATTCEVVINGDEAVAASFVPEGKPKPEFTLTVEIQGNGSGLITCNDSACAASYPEGAKVSFAAVPLAGSTFVGWSGGGCSGSGACKVTITQDTTILAKFSSKPILTPPPPIEKGTAIASGIAQVQNESALIRLLCPGSSRCTGTLELFARLQDQTHGRRHFHRGSSQATLIGTASFDLAPNSQGTVSVKIVSQRALRLLGRGGDLEAQLLGTSVRARSVRLVGARVRRHRG